MDPEIKELSFDEKLMMVRRAFYQQFSMADDWYDCLDVFEDFIVCTSGGAEYYRAGYSITEEGVEFQPKDEWQQVEREWVTKNVTDELIAFGTEVKSLGGGKIGGYLVKFSDPEHPDLVDDYFDAETDFGLDWDEENKSTVYFNHGFDPEVGKRRFDRATLTKKDAGIWIEGILKERDDYEKMIMERLIKPRKAGWSSGSLSYLVERERVGKAFHIKSWPLGSDASITHIPADPTSRVVPLKSLSFTSLKSLISTQPPTPKGDGKGDGKSQTGAGSIGKRVPQKSNAITVKDRNMAPETQDIEEREETPPDELEKGLGGLKQLIEYNAKLSKQVEDVLDFAKSTPALRKSGYFTEDGGMKDRDIKSAVDMLLAIKRNDRDRCIKHYGLKAQVEDTGVQGGYFVPEATLTGLFPNLSLVSGIGNLVRRVPVPTSAGRSPIRDYSRVPTASVGASASASGMESQARAEGGAYTEETIYFELLEWHTRDYASGYVKMSRELANDGPMVQSMLEEAIREDVANKEEFAILRGTGAGQPLGVLNWSGKIEINEDTDNTFAIADSDEMVSRLLVSPGARIAWVHHNGVYTDIASFERGTGGAVYQSNISGALSTALHGYPRFNSQHLPAQGTDGYVVLGDWSRYYLFEQEGLYINFSEHADFLNGNNVWRFGKRQDGKPAMTSAVTLADGTFTLSPFVILANLS